MFTLVPVGCRKTVVDNFDRPRKLPFSCQTSKVAGRQRLNNNIQSKPDLFAAFSYRPNRGIKAANVASFGISKNIVHIATVAPFGCACSVNIGNSVSKS